MHMRHIQTGIEKANNIHVEHIRRDLEFDVNSLYSFVDNNQWIFIFYDLSQIFFSKLSPTSLEYCIDSSIQLYL